MGTSVQPYKPKGPNDPYADVSQAMDFAREGVEGYGAALRPGLLREIGNTLGGLNDIGALRSGGTKVALEDIAGRYGDQVGAYAKMASGEALRSGLEAGRLRFDREEARRRRKAGFLKAIGGVLGAGIGFFAGGGPAGAVAGYKVGSGAGGSAEASDATYGENYG